MGFFQKIGKGANRFFGKVESGTNTFFKKAGDGLNDAANWASGAVNDVAGVGKQVGNFLEKNAGTIGAVASAVAPEFAPEIMTATSAAQKFGRQIKSGSSNIANVSNNVIRSGGSTISNALNTSQNTINNALGNAQMRAGGLMNVN